MLIDGRSSGSLTSGIADAAAPRTDVQFVCVSHRPAIFDAFVGNNPNVSPSRLHKYDNSVENIGIASRYNDFIETTMADGWVVFMHHDMSFDEPLEPLLAQAPKDSIYGVVGTLATPGRRFLHLGRKSRFRAELRRGRWSQIRVMGKIKCRDDLSPTGWVGEIASGFPVVDTVDCCCVIVHSDLIRRHQLRFNSEFPWHFYSEEFSLRSRREHGILTRVVQVDCGHYGHGATDKEFTRAQNALIDEYGRTGFSSTCYIPPLSLIHI